MMKKYTFIFSEISKTILLSTILASVCIKGCIIYLYGGVGVGKSVFCREFLRALGYTGSINSPTYTLIESYAINNWYIHHFDFYRLNFSEEFENLGLRDYFDGNAVCLVEWPKSNMRILPTADISITINYYNSYIYSRKIIIRFISDIGNSMLQSGLPYWKFLK